MSLNNTMVGPGIPCVLCGQGYGRHLNTCQVVNAQAVNHPSHYNTGKIEVIDFIDDQRLGFYEGQVIKYVSRAKHKGSELQDLKKAQWYLNRLVTSMEASRNK